MTRRERMQRRLEKREAWAGSAKAESDRRLTAAHNLADQIPMGQPVLVGHHSEKRHRRHLDRIDSNMRKGCEAQDRAQHHEAVASTLEDRLETNIFSDDHDAVEQLEARIAEREAQSERLKTLNVAIRKVWKTWKPLSEEERVKTPFFGQLEHLSLTDSEKKAIVNNMQFDWRKEPMFPGYHLSNLRARIKADQDRLKDIKRRQERAAEAEAAGGVSIRRAGENEQYATVTFAEKPDRDILDALRGAGFHWSGGSWHGYTEKLPESVRALCSTD